MVVRVRSVQCLSVSWLTLILVPCFAHAGERPPQYSADGIRVPAAHADEPVRESVSFDLALSHLDEGAEAWSKARKCVSCHTNGTYLGTRAALTTFVGAPDSKLRRFFVDELRELEGATEEKLHSGVTPTQAVYIAWGLAEWDKHVSGTLSPETRDALDLAFRAQSADGSWGNVDCWPPLESDTYHGAIMMALAIAAAPGWQDLKHEILAQQGREGLLRFLRETAPPHDYSRVWLLRASTRFPELLDAAKQRATIEMLREQQRADGGWSIRTFAAPESWGNGKRAEKIRSEASFDAPASDGHQTGLVLLALLEAGVSRKDPMVARGLEWLRSNQRQSGRWWTRSLNTDKRHYITFSATSYALLALAKGGSVAASSKQSTSPPEKGS